MFSKQLLLLNKYYWILLTSVFNSHAFRTRRRGHADVDQGPDGDDANADAEPANQRSQVRNIPVNKRIIQQQPQH